SVCGKTNPAACAVPDPSVQAELRSLGGRVGFVLGLRRLRRCGTLSEKDDADFGEHSAACDPVSRGLGGIEW
ncbi:unnamed protein product, partial [Effrenium voratum]